MWRKPTQVGVKFERSLAEAAQATLALEIGRRREDGPAQNAAEPATAEPAKTA